MSEDYDSAEGILRNYLADLDGLHELIKERREAGYQRKEHLNEFLILGRWFTDACGNFGRMRIQHHYKEITWAKELAPVLPAPAFWKLFNEDGHFSMTTSIDSGSKIPRSHDQCPVCLKGWTLETADDAYPWREVETPRLLHRNCMILKKAKEGRAFYTDLFTKAGFHWFVLDEIPNEYWKDSLEEPWYLCRTLAGTIKIGWRKRVMSINWEDTKRDLSALFEHEAVTKEAHMIHAWSAEKALEYLVKIRGALGC